MKRNSLMKRIATGVLAFSLIIPAVPAGAHYNYDPYTPEKDGVKILTSRIDNLDIVEGDIDVDTAKKRITVKSNVEFYLDCTVDCDWSSEGLNINSDTGLVTIPTGTAPDTYSIKATAKNVQTSGQKWDEWSVVVSDIPAKAKNITLVPVEDEQVVISGDSISVKGRVTEYPVQTVISPSYIDNKKVKLSCESNSVSFDSDEDQEGLVYLSTNAKTTNAKIIPEVGSGNDHKPFDEKFNITVEGLSFKANWNVNDSELDPTYGSTYNIPADKYAYFVLEDNSEKTIPYKEVVGYEWEFTNNNDETGFPSSTYIVKDNNTNTITVKGIGTDNVPTEAGIIRYYGNRVDVMTYPGADKLEVPEVKLVPTVSHDNNKADDVTPAPALVLNLGGNGVATVDAVDFDFTRVGYLEGKDYSVLQEDIGSEKGVDVYYMNADDKEINLSALVDTTNRNVVSFEKSRANDFSQENNAYSATFSITKLNNNAFGSITDKYQVQDEKFWSTDYISAVGDVQRSKEENDNRFLLHKIATGYFVLSVNVKSSANTNGVTKSIYVRLVSDSNCLFSVEDPSTNGKSYNKDEVIHIRKGEAVQPKEWNQSVIFSEYNEYADISFEDLSGNVIPDGKIVSVLRDNKGNIKINGLQTGFVKVIFTNRVNPDIKGYLYVYVNNDDLYADEYEFNFDDAISKRYMSKVTVVEGKQSKIALRIRATGNQNNIGEWSPSDFDFAITTDPTGEYAEIKDGYLVTKKATTNPIKLQATRKGSDTVIANAQFTINEVKATEISKIGVETSNTDVTAVGDNAGKCEVGTKFNLIPVELLPENATTNDITITSWASEKEEIASVEKVDKSTGAVTALAAGSTVITAHYSIGSINKDLKYTLTVTESNKIKKIIPTSTDITLSRVQATATIEFTTDPALDNPSVEFVAADPTIIDVNPTTGVITAKKAGTTTVTITSKDDASVKAVVNVKVEGADDVVPEDNAVTEARAAIDAIGTVTADDASKAKIDAARAAYDKLTEEQKNALGESAKNTLTTAESTYSTAKATADKAAADKAAADKAAADKAAADKAAADTAVKSLVALPAATAVTTNDKAAIEAARAEYAKLTPDQQKLVSADALKKLTDAEEALKTAEADEAAAKNIQSVKAKIKVAKNLKGKKVKVGVSAITGAKGYQIKYSTKKNMKSSKTKSITKANVTLTKLKKGKTYYIQARGYSEYNGQKYYSKWSAKKKVKVNK